MKIVTTEAEAWWIGLADEIKPERGINTRALIDGLVQRFKFFVVPTTIPVEGGINFERGTFGDVNIAKLSVYSDGLSVSVPSVSDEAELVLQEVLQFFFTLGVKRPTTPPIAYPVSRIVVDFDHSIDALFAQTKILDSVSNKLALPGPASVQSIRLNIDALTLPRRLAGINPTTFVIERRAEVAYADNRYFSFSNMATKNHVTVLEEIERATASRS